jgi:hypothetical protein
MRDARQNNYTPIGSESLQCVAKFKDLGTTITYQNYIKVKVSLCLTKHHAMKVYWRSGGIAPLIL